jgi:metal-responsive CopG/Arc/MetJ family transcriptional regulator
MKAAISLPDDVFEAAEAVVEARGWSRSRLYTEALRQYLKREDPDQITRQLDEVHGQPDKDREFRRKANLKTAQASDW